jgi:hypothetical protein
MTALKTYADLTIELVSPTPGLYWARLYFSQERRVDEKSPASGLVRFPFEELRAAGQNDAVYGNLLKETLFSDIVLSTFYAQCLANAGGADLRVRVLIDRSAQELHGLRWETLRGPDVTRRAPDDPNVLALISGQPFSRFLDSPEWREIELRQKGRLRALVVVANPADPQQGVDTLGRPLPEVDVAGEVARADQVLEKVQRTHLVSDPDAGQRVTLDGLRAALGQGFDILYLVCHGALLRDRAQDPASPRRPYLLLEEEGGQAKRVEAEQIVAFVRDLHPDRRPRLVVLASCQSAGQGQGAPAESKDEGAMAAIGPRLVDAGVPAVVAMQGNVTMQTVAEFMPAFFKELLDHGQVDRAIASARSLVRARADWWMPVLYLRLRGGRLWYDPGFALEGDNAEYSWDALLGFVEEGRCVPVIGPGLLENLLGPPEEIAASWAASNRYPFARHTQQEITQVAQYLAIRDGGRAPRKALRTRLTEMLRARLQDAGVDASGLDLPALLGKVGQLSAADPMDPYQVLARLPFPIYVTSAVDNLLEQALAAQQPKRNPTVLYYCWKSTLRKPELVRLASRFKNSSPTPAQPLVVHMFGVLDEEESWMLSEDDFFEYLMWINRKDNLIPDLVLKAWATSPLLFLGFKIHDWKARVLFRSILNEDRWTEILRTGGPRPSYRSLAVQIQPGDDNLRPEGVRAYLRNLFPSNYFDLYWGSAENFLSELWKAWEARPGGDG